MRVPKTCPMCRSKFLPTAAENDPPVLVSNVECPPAKAFPNCKHEMTYLMLDKRLFRSHILPSDPKQSWIYGFHGKCWRFLCDFAWTDEGRYLDNDLFAAEISKPVGNGVVNWRNGLTLREWTAKKPGNTTLLDVSAIRISRASYETTIESLSISDLNRDWSNFIKLTEALTPTGTTVHSTEGDDHLTAFSPKIVNEICVHLPTKAAAKLREASPYVASIKFSEAFWKSRFGPDKELSNIKDEDIQVLCANWKEKFLYCYSQAEFNKRIARRRVWDQALGMYRLINRAFEPSTGRPLRPQLRDNLATPTQPDDWHMMTIPDLEGTAAMFIQGLGGLPSRTVCLESPLDIDRFYVSFVRQGTVNYVSGLRFPSHDGRTFKVLGHIRRDTEVCVYLDSDDHRVPAGLIGWNVAMDDVGVVGIAAVSGGGSPQPWIGVEPLEYQTAFAVSSTNEPLFLKSLTDGSKMNALGLGITVGNPVIGGVRRRVSESSE